MSIPCKPYFFLVFPLVILALAVLPAILSMDQSIAETTRDTGSISYAISLSEKKCQLAVWLTDDQGRFIDTVYVSRKTGLNGLGNRKGGLDDKWGGARLSLLPVWAHQRGVDYGGGNFYPPKDKPLPDAVSSATPPAGVFNLTWHPPKPLPAGEYYFFVEVNKSFDDNDHHNYSWYRGQPSVIWRGTLAVGHGPAKSEGRIIGHGHPAGADGEINADLSTLTTALKLIEGVVAATSR